jgi:hypothetical protein
MAKKELVENIVKLYSKLGGNMNDVLGSRSNVTFLGTGKNPEPFIDMSINMEAVGALGKSKILEELKSPMGYLTADKLNDIQAGKLYENMLKLDEFYNPKQVANITDMDTGTGNLTPGGLASLRQRLASRTIKETDDLPPPGSRGGPDDIAAPFESAEDTIKNLERQDPELAVQFKNIFSNRAELPAKRASAREFLNNALKEDDILKTNLNSVVSAEDVKYITEGGGGVMGDPLVLVEKYFGPRISEAIPVGATGEEIITFTRRVMNNVEDAKGFKPDDPRFDRFTARFVDEMAEGGRAGYRFGKSVFKGIGELFNPNKKMFRSRDDVPTSTFSEMKGPIRVADMDKIPESELRKIMRTQELGLYTETPEILKAGNLLERFTKVVGGKRVIDYERAEDILGTKLRGDETLDELFAIEFRTRPKAAQGGLAKILEV